MTKKRLGGAFFKSHIRTGKSQGRSRSKFFIYSLLVLYLIHFLLILPTPLIENASAAGPGAPAVSNYFVTPLSGYNTTNFHYYANYTDTQGDWPTVINVKIDDLNQYNMTKVSGISPQFGLVYRYITKLSQGQHNFTIVYNDGNSSSPDYETNVTLYPYVMSNATPPGKVNLTNGRVTPTSGTTDTPFTFEVTYSNTNGSPPDAGVVYLIVSNNTYSMQYVSGSNLTGAIYRYTLNLGEGNHGYAFECYNNNNKTRLPISGFFSGPMVTAGTISLTSGIVTPVEGTTSTLFNYSITYTHNSDEPPTTPLVYIDGVSHSMSHNAGNYSNGVGFWYNTFLSAGQHNYYFKFSDDNASARLPAIASNNTLFWGPAVFSDAVVLSNGNVTPQSGYLYTPFNFSISYQGGKDGIGGDRTDNDADGRIDEELYNSKDDDNDGYIDEDCAFYTKSGGGELPNTAYVIIDGGQYDMSHNAGDYIKGADFWFETNLTGGMHSYYFEFRLGNVTERWPAAGYMYGPTVSTSFQYLYKGNLTPVEGNITTLFSYIMEPNVNKIASGYPMNITGMQVVIDGVAYNMSASPDFDDLPLPTFFYNTTLDVGDHNYYFQFTINQNLVRIPPTAIYPGPKVWDMPARLYSGTVNPNVGVANTTAFDFSVKYADLEGKAPTDAVLTIWQTNYNMQFASGSNKTGALYSYKTTLPTGNYQYFFIFNDGANYTRYPADGFLYGPFVSPPGQPINYPPELWNGTVSPTSGNTKTTFTYSVFYKDKNNDDAMYGQVYINGTPRTMQFVEGNNLTGAKFAYTTTMPVGSHSFYFTFMDINYSTSRLPAVGTYNGPTVLPAPNEPPVLSNGTVSPTSGNTSVLFTYTVHYKDAESDTPALKKVYIDGYPFTMILSKSSYYNEEKAYTYTTTLGAGNHTYYFLFNDSKNEVRYPATGVFFGPYVTLAPDSNNTAPTLRYGTVSPTVGTQSTTFTYYVYYYDADGDKPTINHVSIDGTLYQMTPSSQNYPDNSQGLYTYSTTLAIGNHTYYFLFSDGIAKVRLPATGVYTGPVVLLKPQNLPPVLTSGMVNPTAGTTLTDFVFSVKYRDPEGAAPTLAKIYIDSTPYTMSFSSGTFNINALYEYTTKLSVGNHYYHFLFSDGTNTVRLPSKGSFYGPVVVKPNRAPTADAGADQVHTVGPPKTVYFDGGNSSDPDDDKLVFFWDFGDGGYAYGEQVSHTFHGVGTYQVTLKVSDGQLVAKDTTAIKITDSGQGKSKGKAPKKDPKLDDGWNLVPLSIAAFAGIAAIGIGGVIITTEWGLYAFLALILPLYVRISGKKILDNFTRGKIYGYIIANPGDHYNSIKTALKLKNGALAYHLKALEREDLIKSQSDGKYKRFYPYEMSVPTRATQLSTMRRNIVNQIEEEPGITQNEISEKMGVSHQAISYHLRTLVQIGAVNVEKKGRANHCYPGEYNGNLDVGDESELGWT